MTRLRNVRIYFCSITLIPRKCELSGQALLKAVYLQISPYSFGTLCTRGQIRFKSQFQKNCVLNHGCMQLFSGSLFFWDGNCTVSVPGYSASPTYGCIESNACTMFASLTYIIETKTNEKAILCSSSLLMDLIIRIIT